MAPRDRLPKLKGPGEKERAYEVGYRKPPVATRFQPGQSGNPNGRPRGAHNSANRTPALNAERMKSVVLEEAYRPIVVRDGERLVEIPVIQAVIRAIAANAAKGHHRSQQLFSELVQQVEGEKRALHEELLERAIEYKRDWEQELERRKPTGETGREPIPHPDDIVIDAQTGEVEVRGPMTKEEKVKWDRARENMEEHDEFLAEIEKRIKKRPRDKALRAMLARHRKIGAKVKEAIGAYAARLHAEEREKGTDKTDAEAESGRRSAETSPRHIGPPQTLRQGFQ